MNERIDQSESAVEQLSPKLCKHIIQRLGEGGQPPEYGVRAINVGNESYLNILEHEYFEHQLQMGASFKLVEGYFGGGKTHFLYCVREMAWDRGFPTAVVELSPAECPYDDSFKVYKAVARRISRQPANPLAAPNYGLPDLLRNLVDDKRQKLLESDASGVATEEAAQEAIDEWLSETVARTSCESHSYRSAIVGFARAYLKGHRADEQKLEAWLMGEPIPKKEIRDLGVYEQLDRSNGFTMLRCLTQMMVGLGLPGSVFLFDEVDRNLSVSSQRSQVIGDNLRQVIDLCGRHQLPNTLFLYAVPPEFLRNVVPDYPALYQRLKSPVPMSVRSPQAVLIDLEELDLEPIELLTEIGSRVLNVFEKARDVSLERDTQRANARALAEACAESYFEVNHRRLFVKTWVDLLYRQMVDGEMSLSTQDASDLVLEGYEAIEEEPQPDDFMDF